MPRNIGRDPRLPRKALQFGKQRPVLGFCPRLDRTFIQSFFFVGDDEIEIEIDGVAEALATRTRAIRIVKRKQPRLGLFVAAAVVLALEALRKTQPLRRSLISIANRGFENHFARLAISDLDRVDNARALVRRDDQTVHQPKHRHGEIDVQQRLRSRELKHLPVLKQPVEPAFAQIEQARLHRIRGQFRLDRSFLRARLLGALLFRILHGNCVRLNRKEHIQPRPLAQSQQPLDNFVHRIFFHFLPAQQAVRAPDARKQQPQIIEDLRRRGDGRTRIARGVLLLDGHGRRDAIDHVDIRLLNPLQELPRIGGERLHIPPLPFGVDRIERKRGFPRPRHARNHGQSVVLDLKIDVLEVVNPGPANHYAIARHLPLALQAVQKSLPNLSIICVGGTSFV